MLPVGDACPPHDLAPHRDGLHGCHGMHKVRSTDWVSRWSDRQPPTSKAPAACPGAYNRRLWGGRVAVVAVTVRGGERDDHGRRAAVMLGTRCNERVAVGAERPVSSTGTWCARTFLLVRPWARPPDVAASNGLLGSLPEPLDGSRPPLQCGRVSGCAGAPVARGLVQRLADCSCIKDAAHLGSVELENSQRHRCASGGPPVGTHELRHSVDSLGCHVRRPTPSAAPGASSGGL